MSSVRIRSVHLRRWVAVLTSTALAGVGLCLVSPPATASSSPCADGSAPALLSTVSCTGPGYYTLTVPPGTSDVDVDAIGAGGGAGYPARSHIGGNAAEVSGNLTLPAGTSYLYVIVGAAGTGDNHGTSSGGGASAVLALDSGHNLLAKLVIAGAGGGGAYNGDGGNAGSAGTTENAALSTGGSPGIGAVGGAGGTGNYSNGGAGGTNNPATATVAAGGAGGAVQGGAYGGGGAGGYAGGGGGGGGTNGILTRNIAGGGGGSSLASAYLGAASISIAPNTGGVQLPGLVAGDGATGQVTLTFNGLAVPSAPTGATATAGDGQASVSFTAPASDGGSPITSYTVTASPGGLTATCPGSPCMVTGLTNGTSYTFTVHATNANGDSPESTASAAVTAATPPGAPTGAAATAGDGQASVSFTAPASDGGSAITSYTVTSAPGGLTATCPGSPCVITGLTNGTSYTFTVHATNGIGDSPESAASTAVTPLGAPSAPTGVTLTPGDQQVTASFPIPDDQGSAITGYQVSTDGGQTWQTLFTTTANGTVTGTVGGLINGVTYSVRVRALNSEGPGAASAAQDVTPSTVPDTPTGASATAGDGQAVVSFTAPASDGGNPITSYTVTSAPGGLTATCPGSPCVVTGLANGTSYTFTVHATNAAGNSAESNASAAVTPVGAPSAPGNVTLTPGDEKVTVSFPVPDDQGSAITGYQVSTDGGLTWITLNTTSANGKLTGSVTGLSNGTTYSVQVRAVNAEGPGDASMAQPVTPATIPDAPTSVSATRGNASVEITFTPPADNGGSAIASYTVTSVPDGVTATCPASPCTITGLANGTSYTFTVHATNNEGDSAESVASNAVIPATVPATPGSVAVSRGDESATVTFTAPAAGGSPITGYEYTTDGGTSWQTLSTTGTAPVTGTITGLVNGTSYSIQVRAVNSVGASPGSAAVAVTPATTPGVPSNVSATAGAGQAEVTFTAPADNGGNAITSYTLTSAPGGLTATCPGSPCTITGLANGTGYTFTVHANNDVGSSAESAASAEVTPVTTPAAPSSVTATATDTSVTVSFTAPDAGGTPITGYQYSLDGGATWHMLATTARGSHLDGTISGLTAGTQYSIVVRANNAAGDGIASESLTVATLPAAVPAPVAVAGVSSARVSWTQSDTSSVVGYTVYAHPGPATCTTSARTATSCVIGATSGVSYTYTVVAHGPASDSPASPASNAVIAAAPPIPASAPTNAPSTLTTTDGVLTMVTPGQQITLVGSGFLAYSSVSIILYSTPTVLGNVVTDAHGNFRKLVTIPAGLSAGAHTLIAAGVDPGGLRRLIQMPVTVPAPAGSGTTGSTNTGSGSTGSGSTGALPFTGSQVLWLAVWGALLTGAGLACLSYGRRPQASSIQQ